MSASQVLDLGGGIAAGADLSAVQYAAVKLSAAGTIVVCAAATDICIGFVQNAPASGQPASVVHSGRGFARAGGAIAAVGTRLMAAAAGEVVDWTTGNPIVGISLAVAADNSITEILYLLTPDVI